MNTVVRNANEFANLKKASEILKTGELVAFPTETVYGLGANALNANAVKKIYVAKGRPSDNPLIVHIDDLSWIKKLSVNVPDVFYELARVFWPGPLTIIVNKSKIVPFETSGGLETIGIRMPQNEVARKLIEISGIPISAPSANKSGSPSPTKAVHVYDDLKGRIPFILDGGSSEKGIESTIIDITSKVPCILRPGSITKEMIEKEIGRIDVDKSLLSSEKFNLLPKAPGMKYKHYAPKANVTVFIGEESLVVKKINETALGKDKIGILATEQTKKFYDDKIFFVQVLGDRNDLQGICNNLFNSLRIFDGVGVEEIYAEGFSELGLGFSIMNRLKKAAGYEVVIC